MARIKINDISKNKKISKEEMKKVSGGYLKYELKNVMVTSFKAPDGGQFEDITRTFGLG